MWWKSVLLYVCVMATVKYRLEKPQGIDGPKKKEVTIYCRVTVDRNNRFEFSTKQRIPPKYWDVIAQEVKPNYVGSKVINIELSRLKTALLELWNSNKDQSIPELREKSINLLKSGSDTVIVPKKKNDFELFIADHIKRIEDGKIARRYGTLKQYKVTFRNLKKFSAEKHYPLSFQSINMDFYHEYCGWCWDEKKYQDSTLYRDIKHVKTFMGEAMHLGLHQNTQFRKKQFVCKSETESDNIYLTAEEILTIYNTDLSELPHLIESRDLFVAACWLGLRYSDLAKIKPNHIQNNTIRITTTKTGEDVVIPLHPLVLAIYKKYGNALPEAKANQNFNYDLKTIAEKAELKSKCQARKIVRGEATFEWFDKHELVTAHTARRSFATNCYKMGVPTRSIMAITGHKTEKAFEKYIKLSKDEHAAIMLDVFNKQSLMKIA
jgi:integrase